MSALLGRTTLAGAACAALVIALLFIPVSYNLRIGSVVEAEWSTNETDVSAIRHDLSNLDGMVRNSVSIDDGKAFARLAFLKTGPKSAGRTVEEVLTRHIGGGEKPVIHVEEIVKRIGGNALAWASGGRISIRAKGTSEEEIAESIIAELRELGFGDADAEVKMSEDGVVQINISSGEVPEGAVEGESLTIEIEAIELQP